MVNIKKEIFNKNNSDNSCDEKHPNSEEVMDSNFKQIDHLNNKIDEFQDIMMQKFNSINLENKKVNSLNDLLLNNLDSLVEENKKMSEELDSLIKNNNDLTKDMDLLKKENKKLKADFKKNNKILDSYNENFKILFYFYDLKPKGILMHLQNLCQEVLTFVSNVCKKYNIEYWVEGGTHLGAVRHGGFLPWDDDIDLGMMRKDYNKFIEFFKDELKIHNLENKMKFRLLRHGNNVLYFVQISFAGMAVLDIFPYDYIENPPENIKELYDEEKSKFKSNILNGKKYEDSVKELHNNLKLSYDKQPFVIPGVERPALSPFHVQKTSELFPLKEISFNGVKYTSHKNDDYHLQKLYGDWKSLPKVLDRHNRVYLFLNRPNRINDLKENYKLLKSINNSFN